MTNPTLDAISVDNPQDRKKLSKTNRYLSLALFPCSLIYLEIIYRSFILSSGFSLQFINTILTAVVLGCFLNIITRIGHGKFNRWFSFILIGIICFIYISQAIYYTVFDSPFVLFSVSGAGQVLQFADVIFSTIMEKLVPIIFMIIPLIIHIGLWHSGIRFPRLKFKRLLFQFFILIGALLINLLILMPGRQNANSNYHIYYQEVTGNIVINRFGLMVAMKNDFKSSFMPKAAQTIADEGWTEEEETTHMTISENVAEEATAEEIVEKVPNIMDIDFDTLIANETDDTIKTMHQYFKNVSPTYVNEYTGMFEGYNLIFLTAEGFSTYAIDEKLTPTLYKLSHQGFNFPNFYCPLWGVSTSDGEYVNCMSLIPKSNVWSMFRSSENNVYFTMGNQFQRLGYNTYAYHAHTYDYYDRDLSHPNMGYDYKGIGNGFDVEYIWPESDLEAMEVSIPEYINDEKFHVYYMTISGHLNYNFTGNAMSIKNKALVDSLDYSEEVKAYLACQIELDRALEYLINELDAAGKLDNTVIALSADHYPYGLSSESINELAGHTVEENFELYKNTFILWNSQMTEPVTVDKYCSSLDINPTLSNLFGLEYDSRLLMGQDILSTADPLVIFLNKSWITDRAMYNAVTGEVTQLSDAAVTDAYVNSINSRVTNKFNFSTEILDQDYYRILFGDSTPVNNVPASTSAAADTADASNTGTSGTSTYNAGTFGTTGLNAERSNVDESETETSKTEVPVTAHTQLPQ